MTTKKKNEKNARDAKRERNGKVIRIHETYSSVYEEYQGVRVKTVV